MTKQQHLFATRLIVCLFALLTTVGAWAIKTQTVSYTISCNYSSSKSNSTITIKKDNQVVSSWNATDALDERHWEKNVKHDLADGMNVMLNDEEVIFTQYVTKLTTKGRAEFIFETPNDNIVITGVQFKDGNSNVPASYTYPLPARSFHIRLYETTSITGFEVTYGYISGSCGDGATWSLHLQKDKNDKYHYTRLDIGGSGAMSNYSDNNAPWGTDLTSVTIGSSITSIGENAFYNCSQLATVTLNSNPEIDKSSFPDNAVVTMNVTAKEGAKDEYWATFYNKNCKFQAADDTQIFKAALTEKSLALTELNQDKIVNNNNAVILKSTGSPIVMTLTTATSGNNFKDNSLRGVDKTEGLTATNPSTIYVLNKKKDVVGFYQLKAGNTLGIGKVYLTYSSTDKAREFFAFDEETTAIDDVRSQKEVVRGEIYDLQGRRVTQPAKGLYIVNGKKVNIK